MGHTPIELVQKRAAEIEAMLEAWDAPSPPSPPSRDNPENGKLPSQKQADRIRSSQRPRLATPSPSDINPDTPAPLDTAPAITSRWKRLSSIEPADLPLIAAILQRGLPAFCRLPPGELPSPPLRRRKRDGPRSSPGGGGATKTAADGAEELDPDVGHQPAERPPAKRRATRRAAALAEGLPRRSARIAVLPRKNYKV